MSNEVKLTFAGDAGDLSKAAKQAEQATTGVGDATKKAAGDFGDAAGGSADLTTKMGHLGSAVSGASDAIGSAGDLLSNLNDVQQASVQKAARHARALVDVQQAQEDANQAIRDSKQALIDAGQAEIDATQANLDAATAQSDYNTAVKEHGRNSAEARQSSIDLKQAQLDLKQANEDGQQAIRDGSQATIDAKSAQLDLNDAQSEAHPPDMAKWAEDLGMIMPLVQSLIGIMGLVTAAQWAWNAAQLASPTTWIIAGIAVLIGIIVAIAVKTQWFQQAWRASWSAIKSAAANTWEFLQKIPGWIGSAFARVGNAITAPFRSAFNFVSDAWNATVGSLHWSVPGWVPGIGGQSIGVPKIPHFHSGVGSVPGTPGSEVLTVLQAGEKIGSASGSIGGGGDIVIRSGGSQLDDLLVDILARAIGRRGGNVQTVLGNGRG